MAFSSGAPRVVVDARPDRPDRGRLDRHGRRDQHVEVAAELRGELPATRPAAPSAPGRSRSPWWPWPCSQLARLCGSIRSTSSSAMPAAIVDHTVRKPVEELAGVGPLGLGLDDVVAQVRQHRRRRLDRRRRTPARPRRPSAFAGVTRMRSRPGSTPTSSRKRPAVRRRHVPRAAVQLGEHVERCGGVGDGARDTTPEVDAEVIVSTRLVMRLRLGFSPTSPLHDAGMRIDPPPSEACAIGAMPGGHRRARAARRSARGVVGVPRVAGRRRAARTRSWRSCRTRASWSCP